MPPVKSYKLGAGELILGETGAPLDVSAQATSVKLTPSSETEDDVHVLSGDVLSGEDTDSWTLNGTFVQDLDPTGNVRFCLANKGKIVPFRFVPNSEQGTEFSGTCKIRPIEIGGDAKTKPTSDFEFPVIGDPIPSDGLT